MARSFAHRPVLLDATRAHLNLKPGAVVLDGTLGGGGHAEAILHESRPDGLLIGLDLDPEALAAAAERLERFGERVRCVHASFRDLEAVLQELGIEFVDGVLFDLGVSSHQLDTADRGFRFSGEAEATPLDMRMDPTRGPSAAHWLRRASETELQRCFQEYGELPGSRRLSRAIVEAREQSPIETAADLMRIVREARVGGGRRHHPATRVFQALRIEVNDELGALRAGLDAAVAVLRPGGRLVVIAYHSLEDRLVKNHLRDGARGCVCPPRTPVCICGRESVWRVLTRKPLRPTEDELQENPRARSGRLRAAERLARRLSAGHRNVCTCW